MPKKKPAEGSAWDRKIKPSITAEGRELQLAALAIDRIEQRILEGTASSQELLYCAKLGSETKQLENERLREENRLLRAKTADFESRDNSEEFYKQVVDAVMDYSGRAAPETYEDVYDDEYDY